MKVLGIDSYSYLGKVDGAEHTAYTFFAEVKKANVGGSVIRQFNVTQSVLNVALKIFNFNNVQQFLGQNVDMQYYYDRDKRFSRVSVILPVLNKK